MKLLFIIIAMLAMACNDSYNRRVTAKVIPLEYTLSGGWTRMGIMEITRIDSLYVPGDTVAIGTARFVVIDIEH